MVRWFIHLHHCSLPEYLWFCFETKLFTGGFGIPLPGNKCQIGPPQLFMVVKGTFLIQGGASVRTYSGKKLWFSEEEVGRAWYLSLGVLFRQVPNWTPCGPLDKKRDWRLNGEGNTHNKDAHRTMDALKSERYSSTFLISTHLYFCNHSYISRTLVLWGPMGYGKGVQRSSSRLRGHTQKSSEWWNLIKAAKIIVQET